MPGMGHCSGGEGPSKFDLLTPMMAWVEGNTPPGAIMTHSPTAGEQSMFGLPGRGQGRSERMMPSSGTPPQDRPQMTGLQSHDMGPPPGAPAPPVVPARSRPIYPYPYVAAYAGHGDPDAGANWERGKAVPAEVPVWAGSDYYMPNRGVTG